MKRIISAILTVMIVTSTAISLLQPGDLEPVVKTIAGAVGSVASVFSNEDREAVEPDYSALEKGATRIGDNLNVVTSATSATEKETILEKEEAYTTVEPREEEAPEIVKYPEKQGVAPVAAETTSVSVSESSSVSQGTTAVVATETSVSTYETEVQVDLKYYDREFIDGEASDISNVDNDYKVHSYKQKVKIKQTDKNSITYYYKQTTTTTNKVTITTSGSQKVNAPVEHDYVSGYDYVDTGQAMSYYNSGYEYVYLFQTFTAPSVSGGLPVKIPSVTLPLAKNSYTGGGCTIQLRTTEYISKNEAGGWGGTCLVPTERVVAEGYVTVRASYANSNSYTNYTIELLTNDGKVFEATPGQVYAIVLCPDAGNYIYWPRSYGSSGSGHSAMGYISEGVMDYYRQPVYGDDSIYGYDYYHPIAVNGYVGGDFSQTESSETYEVTEIDWNNPVGSESTTLGSSYEIEPSIETVIVNAAIDLNQDQKAEFTENNLDDYYVFSSQSTAIEYMKQTPNPHSLYEGGAKDSGNYYYYGNYFNGSSKVTSHYNGYAIHTDRYGIPQLGVPTYNASKQMLQSNPWIDGEKWVTYYDEEGTELVENNTAKLVEKVEVWLYNRLKTFNVQYYDSLNNVTANSEGYYVANSGGAEYTSYYNQRFGTRNTAYYPACKVTAEDASNPSTLESGLASIGVGTTVLSRIAALYGYSNVSYGSNKTANIELRNLLRAGLLLNPDYFYPVNNSTASTAISSGSGTTYNAICALYGVESLGTATQKKYFTDLLSAGRLLNPSACAGLTAEGTVKTKYFPAPTGGTDIAASTDIKAYLEKVLGYTASKEFMEKVYDVNDTSSSDILLTRALNGTLVTPYQPYVSKYYSPTEVTLQTATTAPPTTLAPNTTTATQPTAPSTPAVDTPGTASGYYVDDDSEVYGNGTQNDAITIDPNGYTGIYGTAYTYGISYEAVYHQIEEQYKADHGSSIDLSAPVLNSLATESQIKSALQDPAFKSLCLANGFTEAQLTSSAWLNNGDITPWHWLCIIKFTIAYRFVCGTLVKIGSTTPWPSFGDSRCYGITSQATFYNGADVFAHQDLNGYNSTAYTTIFSSAYNGVNAVTRNESLASAMTNNSFLRALAEANGITNWTGSFVQIEYLCWLATCGQLVKENQTVNITDNTGSVVRTSVYATGAEASEYSTGATSDKAYVWYYCGDGVSTDGYCSTCYSRYSSATAASTLSTIYGNCAYFRAELGYTSYTTLKADTTFWNKLLAANGFTGSENATNTEYEIAYRHVCGQLVSADSPVKLAKTGSPIYYTTISNTNYLNSMGYALMYVMMYGPESSTYSNGTAQREFAYANGFTSFSASATANRYQAMLLKYRALNKRLVIKGYGNNDIKGKDANTSTKTIIEVPATWTASELGTANTTLDAMTKNVATNDGTTTYYSNTSWRTAVAQANGFTAYSTGNCEKELVYRGLAGSLYKLIYADPTDYSTLAYPKGTANTFYDVMCNLGYATSGVSNPSYSTLLALDRANNYHSETPTTIDVNRYRAMYYRYLNGHLIKPTETVSVAEPTYFMSLSSTSLPVEGVTIDTLKKALNLMGYDYSSNTLRPKLGAQFGIGQNPASATFVDNYLYQAYIVGDLMNPMSSYYSSSSRIIPDKYFPYSGGADTDLAKYLYNTLGIVYSSDDTGKISGFSSTYYNQNYTYGAGVYEGYTSLIKAIAKSNGIEVDDSSFSYDAVSTQLNRLLVAGTLRTPVEDITILRQYDNELVELFISAGVSADEITFKFYRQVAKKNNLPVYTGMENNVAAYSALCTKLKNRMVKSNLIRVDYDPMNSVHADSYSEHLVPYGYTTYTGTSITASDKVTYNGTNLVFSHWSYDTEGKSVASTDESYKLRITGDVTLYAVYAPANAVKDELGVSVLKSPVEVYKTETEDERTRLNTVINPYNFFDNDNRISHVSAVYVVADSANVVITDAMEEQLRDVIKVYLTNYYNSEDRTTEEIEKDVLLRKAIADIAGIKGANFYVYFEPNLTNKNRMMSVLHYSTDSLANQQILAFGAVRYRSNDATEATPEYQWVVSDNCIDYKFNANGEEIE